MSTSMRKAKCDPNQQMQNAMLIDAAPELLEACRCLVALESSWRMDDVCGYCQIADNRHAGACPVGMAITAIAKAEGRS